MTGKFQPVELRNAGLNCLGESLWWLQTWMVAPATVLVVLLKRYGAGSSMIGSVSSIETGLVALPQILGLYLFHSRTYRKRQLIVFHFLAILPLIALLGFCAWPAWQMDAATRRGLLLGCFAMYIFCCGVVGASWFDWIAHLFRQGIRGRVVGWSFGVASLFGVAGALLAGRLIGDGNDLSVYARLFWLACGIGIVSILIFSFVRDEPRAEKTASRPPSPREVLSLFSHSLADANFRRFLVGRTLWTAGLCSIAPFIATYYAAQGLGEGTIVSCGAAQEAGLAISMTGLGYLGDRRGHRLGILVGAVVQVLTLVVLLSTGGTWSCIVVYALVGICLGAGGVSHLNILYETCPHNNRAAHITLGNLVLALPAMAAPLLAGQLVERLGQRPLFWTCLALAVVALAWFAFKTRDPRDLALDRQIQQAPLETVRQGE